MSVTQQLNSSNNTLVITINGEFNFAINKEFRNAYKDVEPNKNFTVSVDLTHTDYMDSAALGMLLLLDEHFKEQRINLINCSEYIKKALDVVKFEQKFIIT